MKKNRLLALILSLLLLFQTFPAIAASIEDATLYPTDDSYIESSSRWKHKNYGNAGTMLFGNAYDRTALLKFDISNVDISQYEGAVLNISFNAESEGGMIDAYIIDDAWSEKNVTYANFESSYSFAISSDIVRGAGQNVSLIMNEALLQAKRDGSKSISIALKSNSGCVSVFSSESSDVSVRPSLVLTEKTAYISGQRDFKFPEVTRQQIKAELQKAIEKGHPYIIANKEHIDKVKEYAFGKDEFLTEQYAILKANAEKILATDITRIDDNIAAESSFIGDATQIMNEAPVLGLIYLVEGDTRYAQRLYNQMEYLCTLESWGKKQRLDFSFITYAIGICYDWLHDWLSQEQKDILINGLKRNHFDIMMAIYRDPNDPRYPESLYQVFRNRTGNHNVMISSKAFIAAMAFADTDIDYMAELMENCADYYLSCISELYPDGVWNEGLSYWTYVGPPTALWLQSMLSAFGHAFGYEDISFMKKLANYPISCTSEQGSFIQGDTNFTDSNAGSPYYYLIGKVAGDKALQTHAVENAKIYKNPDATLILMYDPEMSYNEELELDKDMILHGSLNIATMRSAFAGQQYTFGGMSVRETTSNWKHVDRGTLALDALGERWITNISKETYYWRIYVGIL